MNNTNTNANTNSSFTHRAFIARTKNDPNGDLFKTELTGQFQCQLTFPQDGSLPAQEVTRQGKNGGSYTQIRVGVNFIPDNSKSESGRPYSPVYSNGQNHTLAEFLSTVVGADLYNGRVYATLYLSKSVPGLKALLSDPGLSFKTQVTIDGTMRFYASQNGKTVVTFGDVTHFGHSLSAQVQQPWCKMQQLQQAAPAAQPQMAPMGQQVVQPQMAAPMGQQAMPMAPVQAQPMMAAPSPEQYPTNGEFPQNFDGFVQIYDEDCPF